MEASQKSPLNLSKFCQMHFSRYLAQKAPLRFSQLYLTCLGKLYFLTHSHEQELIRQTIRQVFTDRLEQPAVRQLIRRTFSGILTHYQEKLFLAYASEAKVKNYLAQRLQLRGTEELQQAIAVGRGVILVTGHFGAVEFLPGALGLHGYPAAIIVRPQTKELAVSLAQRAALINLTLIFPENGKVLPAALKALREGRILITEADEFEMWRPSQTDTVNFLGFQLPADRTLEVLQKRSGSPILTALVHRERQRHYTLNISPAFPSAPPQAAGKQCLQVLEKAIFAAPEQWYQWKEFGKVIAQLPQRRVPALVQPALVPPGSTVDYAHA
jgi:Kdo2-lipid IVA lauroyltransferase/acyltransferase